MTYVLALGDYAYSSWSLRGWLLFEKFGIPRRVHLVDFAKADVQDQLVDFAPARTVPALRTPEGVIVSDSLAMAEELATRHPKAGLWPEDPMARALARTLAAEMHSSYTALRSACPMNLRTAFKWTDPTADVRDDIARIEDLWAYARSKVGGSEPWLCGDYSVADAFFAPVAARIAGYDLLVSDASRAYVEAHLNDLAFRRWRAMGLARGETLSRYAQTHETAPWPGPKPWVAEATEASASENSLCPYSGEPVTHFLTLEGRIFGFCNAFCRDKTVADPEAWPQFSALL